MSERRGTSPPWWDGETPPGDGLAVFVAAATGTDPPGAAPRSWGSPLGEGPRGWGRDLLGRAQGLPRGIVVLGVVLVVVGGLLAASVVLGGGPPADPALPLSDPVAEWSGETAGDEGATQGEVPTDALPAGGALVVHVAGAVVDPGVHQLPAGARVHEAIAAAGGPLPGADLNRLNLAAAVADGTQIHVPLEGSPPAGSAAGAVGGSGTGTAGGAPPGSGGPLSLSTADAAALDSLPGVGPATAAAIIAHREANGPFGSVDELLEVRGIGASKLEGLRDLVVP